MNHFPHTGQSLLYVSTQKPCIVLGGCPSSRLVTIRFENGLVASVQQGEVIPNETSVCHCCGKNMRPDRDGVCKLCKVTKCPGCRSCRC